MRRLSRRSPEGAKADDIPRIIDFPSYGQAGCVGGGCLDEARAAGEVGPHHTFPLIAVLATQAVSAHREIRVQARAKADEHAEFALASTLRFAIGMHGMAKRIVYILRSDTDPSRHYVGITNDVRTRLEWHNHGPCGHTMFGRPWSIVVSMEFASEQAAIRFEKYLKCGSGRAFAKRHFGVLERL